YTKITGTALLVACLASFLSLAFGTVEIAGTTMHAGGSAGAWLAELLAEYLNRTGSIIFILTVLFLAIILSTQFSFGRLFADDEKRPSKTAQPEALPNLAEELPLRILLAEDNVVNQKVALRLLERLGFRADLAANGYEVLDALERQVYDVVLMDVQMPEMDGLEATRAILKTHSPPNRPRIIAMTASALDTDRMHCLEAGMDDFISKPVECEALIEALRKSPSAAKEDFEALMEIYGVASEDKLDLLAVNLPTIDHHVLAHFRTRLCSGDAAIANDLTKSYLDNARVMVDQMEAALQTDDSATLVRLAHTLKSSSQMFGALGLAEHCRLLENAQQPSPTHIEKIRTELGYVLAFFNADDHASFAT
ncbi:MAG: DNA translocase FtsK 4TM domain-containing protein, partial [Bacteroidetes bacterium]|nr:DNA translocase FtsK 4TM domain-containing protein [Bacteroidota bacterium]